MRKPKAYRREQRKDQIHLTLLMDAQRGVRPARTMYKIARALDMRPSMHLMGILNEMVAEGTLIKLSAPKVPGVIRHLYELAPGTYTEFKQKTRQLRMKINGIEMIEEL